MATKTKLNASAKRKIRSRVEKSGEGQLYDYDRIAARSTAVRELAEEHEVSTAEIEELLKGRDSDDEPDPGPAVVETEPDVNPDALAPPEQVSHAESTAAATPGMVEQEEPKKEPAKKAPASQQKRSEPAHKAPAKKAEPAKKTTGGTASRSSGR